MSWRGVTLQTRAASAAERRRRASTSPSLATRIRASTSRVSASATTLPFDGRPAMETTGVLRMFGVWSAHVNNRDRCEPEGHDLALRGGLQGLAVRHFHGGVIAAQLAAVPIRPEPDDLDADRVGDRRGL